MAIDRQKFVEQALRHFEKMTGKKVIKAKAIWNGNQVSLQIIHIDEVFYLIVQFL